MSITTKMTKQGIRDLDFGVARPKPAAVLAQTPVADASPLPAEGASNAVAEGTMPPVTDGGAS
jgi:hypothetical protein